jgi:hypothetical protein
MPRRSPSKTAAQRHRQEKDAPSFTSFSTAAHFAPILQSNEKAGALSRLCSRDGKESQKRGI